MWIADRWQDYKVIDTNNGEKLEKWGDYTLVRPDPQIIWKRENVNKNLWRNINARYHRSPNGGGEWEFFDLPCEWTISYDDLKFKLKPFKFKHTGLFPEQATNWDLIMDLCKSRDDVKVLNLFAYTGGATLAAASAGASVVHVDASKGMIGWARENAAISKLDDKPIRWIADDCFKFVKRELRRNNKYDIIIMDPPSYGRGPNKELWKLEDSIHEFVKLSVGLLSDKPLLFLLNSYTTGLSSSVMKYICELELRNKNAKITSDDLGLPVREPISDLFLPCGSACRCIF